MNLIELVMSSKDSNEVAWIDRYNKEYQMRDIEDRHLLNILSFMCRGKGHVWFLTDDKINALFSEATHRGLKFKYRASAAIRAIHERRYY